MRTLNYLTVDERDLQGAKLEYLQINGGLCPEISMSLDLRNFFKFHQN